MYKTLSLSLSQGSSETAQWREREPTQLLLLSSRANIFLLPLLSLSLSLYRRAIAACVSSRKTFPLIFYFILQQKTRGRRFSFSLSRFPNGECLDLLISFEAVVVEEGEENVAYNKDFLACLNRLFC